MTDQFSSILSPWMFLGRRVRDSVKDVEPATKMRIFGLIYWEHIVWLYNLGTCCEALFVGTLHLPWAHDYKLKMLYTIHTIMIYSHCSWYSGLTNPIMHRFLFLNVHILFVKWNSWAWIPFRCFTDMLQVECCWRCWLSEAILFCSSGSWVFGALLTGQNCGSLYDAAKFCLEK